MSGVPLWDQLRVREMVRTGEGMHFTSGPIRYSWVIENRSRDWSKKSLSYRTTISEGFDIGDQRFSWNRRDSLSGATFTNGGDPPIRFVEGALAEVTWFTDPASDNQRRIVRLALSENKSVAERAASLGLDTAEFDAFWRDFSRAAAEGDEQKIHALTEAPFSFNGVAVDEARFNNIIGGEFIRFIHDCLARAAPREAPDKSRRASCGNSVFIFRRNKAGHWRFVSMQ